MNEHFEVIDGFSEPSASLWTQIRIDRGDPTQRDRLRGLIVARQLSLRIRKE